MQYSSYNDFYTAYLDNIMIYFKNELEYKEYVYKVLNGSIRLVFRLILRN